MLLLRKVLLAVVALAVLPVASPGTAHGFPNNRFRIKISVPDSDRPDFLVPVKEEGEPMFAVIPALPDRQAKAPEESPSYIKVVPQMEGDSIRVKISVLYGKPDQKLSPTEQLKSLREKSLIDFLLAEGQKIAVSELKNLGLKAIEIEVVSSQ
ncbi:MAG: hypothetical protein QOH71_89 [Blastocatellia bacterium]|jgi:hypothetical protein|nr:hypothetical protein [Blastocatellia bacterium]